MIHFSPVEHHIEDRGHTRLCDGRPASDTDVLSEDWFALRDARKAATLCSDCQDNVNPRDVRSELYSIRQACHDRPLVRRAGAGRLRCDKELLASKAKHRR